MGKLSYPKKKESILFTDRGVFAGKHDRHGRMRHVDTFYSVESDISAGDKRVITLKRVNRKDMDKKKKELVEAIAKGLGEEKSKGFKKLLLDVLTDHYDVTIHDLWDRLINKKQPVKMQEGCFKIVFGKGKRKKELMIRD